MEFDQLKDLWKDYTKGIVYTHKVSEKEIYALLSQKSKHTIEKIRRNLVWEGVMVFLASMILVAGLIYFQFPYLVPGITAVIIWMVVVLVLYTIAYHSLSRIELHQDNVKEVLLMLTQKMKFFLQIAHYYTIILAPIFAIGGFFYGLIFSVAQDGKSLGDIGLIPWITILIVLSIFLAIAIKLSKWLIHKLYGVHYQRLVKYAKELYQDM